MSQTALNLLAICIFTITMASLLGPIIHLSPTVPAAITFVLLGLITVDTLQLKGQTLTIVIDALSPETKRQRIIHHEAGHFLAAYLLGIPIAGYSVTAWDAWKQGHGDLAGVQLDQETLLQKTTPNELPLVLERLGTVLMAGMAAEEMIYGSDQGGQGDRYQLREAFKLMELTPQQMEAKEKWLRLQAQNLLQRHREAYDQLAIALRERQPLTQCCDRLQEALNQEPP